MGSPLGVLFAQAYMAYVESKVMELVPEPFIYCRYIDDIFIDIQDEQHLLSLRDQLERNSVLKFTVDKSLENKMPFLDVSVDASEGRFVTTVYRKPSNTGHCLNGKSECPVRYKRSVIRAYVNRALKTCTTWQLTHQELERIRQIFADNGYDEKLVDDEIRRGMDAWQALSSQQAEDGAAVEATPEDGAAAAAEDGAGVEPTSHKLYYKGTMTSAYKKEEKILQSIIKRNYPGPRRRQDYAHHLLPEPPRSWAGYEEQPSLCAIVVEVNQCSVQIQVYHWRLCAPT